jgi:hypothetical protein
MSTVNADLEEWMGVQPHTLDHWQKPSPLPVISSGAKMPNKKGKKARKATLRSPPLPTEWVDQNKRKIKLIHMPVSHLSNAILYLEKRMRTLERYKQAMNKELETRQLSQETRALIMEKHLAAQPIVESIPSRLFRQEDSDG